MRSKDFIKEAGRNRSDDDTPTSPPAQTPDWLKKLGNTIGKKLGLVEPVDLGPEAEKFGQELAAKKSGYTGIDPIVRQRAGMAPATHQEITDYLKDHPSIVQGVTDRNGNPIVSGGLKDVERAARAAAPPDDFDTPVSSPAKAAAAPAAAAVVPEPVPARISKVFQPPAVKAAEPAAEPAAPVAVARPVATPVVTQVDGGQNTEKDAADAAAAAEVQRVKDLAGIVPPAEKPPVAVTDPLAPVTTGSLGRNAEAGVAAAAPAATDDPQKFIRKNKDDDKFDPIEKTPVKPKPKPRPQPNKEPAVPYAASGGTGGGSLNNPQDDMVDGTYIPDPNTGGYTATYQKKSGGQQNATPAAAGNPAYTRFKTAADVDNEIQRFINKGYDLRLPANQQYLNNLTARRAELSGSQSRQNAEPAPAATGSVIVRSGDTLSKIAAANKTTVQAIMAANPSITNANRISVGQTLKLRESSDISRMRFLAGLTKD